MQTTMNTCTRRTLAAGDVAMVEQCACGTVHVTIGAITLRLPARVIASLAATIDQAARDLAVDPVVRARELRGEVVS